MPSWENATWLELAWTLCALVGMGATLYGTWVAVGDFRRAPRQARTLRRIGKIFVRYETALLFLCLVFLIAGVRALGLPPRDQDLPLDWGTALLAVLYLASCVIVTFVSVQNRLDRRRTDRERKTP